MYTAEPSDFAEEDFEGSVVVAVGDVLEADEVAESAVDVVDDVDVVELGKPCPPLNFPYTPGNPRTRTLTRTCESILAGQTQTSTHKEM